MTTRERCPLEWCEFPMPHEHDQGTCGPAPIMVAQSVIEIPAQGITLGAGVVVHHYDIEKHAESYNDGYADAVSQGLADDPTLAADWLAQQRAEAWAEGYAHGHQQACPGGCTHGVARNPYGSTPELCNGRDPAYPGTCPMPKGHPGGCFDDAEVDA